MIVVLMLVGVILLARLMNYFDYVKETKNG
jgi:hypothetical protein